MNYSNEIIHTIGYGDNLYTLANYYNTRIEDILANNRYINPYILSIGDNLRIVPNTLYYNNNRVPIVTHPTHPAHPVPPTHISQKVRNLSDEMNTLWEQHVFWTRLLLISIAENLNDLTATTDRLLRNPRDIADIYRRYYGNEVANKISQLLTDHLLIGSQLIVALKNGETDKAKTLDMEWHKNADDIAAALAGINRHYDRQRLQQMLYEHLRLTTEEVNARLRGDYAADIAAFDRVEKEALRMARYLTDGIVAQFPNMF